MNIYRYTYILVAVMAEKMAQVYTVKDYLAYANQKRWKSKSILLTVKLGVCISIFSGKNYIFYS